MKEEEIKTENLDDSKMDLYVSVDMANSETLSAPETLDVKHENDAVSLNIYFNIDVNESFIAPPRIHTARNAKIFPAL